MKSISVISRWSKTLSLALLSLGFLPAIGFGQMQVGTNLDGVVDWGAAQFVDRLKQQRTWTTRNADQSGPWSTNLSGLIPLDAQGWPTQVPFDPGNGDPMQLVHTVFPIRGAGTYRVMAEGTGQIRFVAAEGMLDPTSMYNRSITFDLTGGQQTFDLVIHDSEFGDAIGLGFLEYIQSNVNDPVRNMKMLKPGHFADYEANPFDPTYTDDLLFSSNLRFMDWASTNGNPTQSWEDRTTPLSYTQTRPEGVSLETLCLLANQMNQDAWFCVPAEADDDYVRNMAAMIRDQLNPDLKVMVEYSNETWNYIFSQTFYVADQGQAQGLDADVWRGAQKFVAKRSAEIWAIFEDEFGDESADRLVKVMASQASSSFITDLRMQFLESPELNPMGIRADAIAIAPYFGGTVGEDIVDDGVVDSITIGEILQRTSDALQTNIPVFLSEHETLAQKYDAWLITYEGGQHLVGDPNNDTLTEKLIAANRDPEMYNMYRTYMNMLNSHSVVMHSNFSYTTEPSRWGSWGILENQDQSHAEAHKYRATIDWLADNPPTNALPIARPGLDRRKVDSNGDGFEPVTLDGSGSRDFDGQIVSYQWSREGALLGDLPTQTLLLPIGDHVIDLTVTDDLGAQTTGSILVTVASSATESVLVQSDFTGTAPAQNTPWTATQQLDANTSFGGWNLGAGMYANDWDNVLGLYGIVNGDLRPLAEAVANDEYISFVISPNAGHLLDLRGAVFSLTLERVDYHAPRRFTLMTSIDGFVVGNEVDGTSLVHSQGVLPFEFGLPADERYLTDQPVEFRIYLSGGQWAHHDMSLNAFQLGGSSVQPDSTVLAQTLTVNRGIQAGGNIASLSLSDNVDLSLQRSGADLQGITEFELKTISPSMTPNSLSFELEASVFARSAVNQSVFLKNYLTGEFEEVDTRSAARFADATAIITPTGDLSRFVEAGTGCMEARIRYATVARRQRFSANVDRAVWQVE